LARERQVPPAARQEPRRLEQQPLVALLASALRRAPLKPVHRLTAVARTAQAERQRVAELQVRQMTDARTAPAWRWAPALDVLARPRPAEQPA